MEENKARGNLTPTTYKLGKAKSHRHHDSQDMLSTAIKAAATLNSFP